MKVKILDVNVENVVKGKSRYSKATVAYSYNGEARTQNIMDFANPSVFKKVKEYIGQEVEVQITKNASGYNEWAAIGDEVSANAPNVSSNVGGGSVSGGSNTATRVTGSNYETPAERAQKQVYIVKQSSISNAIELLKTRGAFVDPNEVVILAQVFVDYVFASDKAPE